MFKMKNLKYVLYIIICCIYSYVISTPQPNLYILLGSLAFTFMATFFARDLLEKLEYSNKKLYIYILFSTFATYLFESMLNSSDFFNDSVINSDILLWIIFLLRFSYILSSIIMCFYALDFNKKYFKIMLLILVTSICIYINILSYIAPYIYIFTIIIFVITNYFNDKKTNIVNNEGENK